jgi:type IV pilus assembly protein PilV
MMRERVIEVKAMKMIMTKNKGQRGFSLLEVLIAVSILAIGLLAAASMQTTAINSNGIANRISVTSALAQEVMEDIMAWSASDAHFATSSSGSTYDLDLNTAATSIQIPTAGTFNATYSIIVNTPATNTATIVVTVTNVETNRQVILTCFKRLI